MNHNNNQNAMHQAAKEIQQEKNLVAALKRLSIGNNMNFDPDLPPDDFEYYTNASSRSFSSDNDIEFQIDFNSDPNSNQNNQFIDNDDDFNFDNTPNSTVNYNISNDDKSLDTNSLLWVPANLHPELAPEQFRLHVKSTVNDIMEKKMRRRSSSNYGSYSSSPPQSPSRFENVRNNEDEYDEKEEKLQDNISNQNQLERKKTAERKFNNPSLKNLSAELKRLSQIAGMDATDAITLARTLSSHSLGYTEVEKQAIDELSSPTSPTSFKSSSSNSSNDEEQEKKSSPVRMKEDDPILAVNQFALRRSTWTTYKKSSIKQNKADKLNELRNNINSVPALAPAPITTKAPSRGTYLEVQTNSNSHANSSSSSKQSLNANSKTSNASKHYSYNDEDDEKRRHNRSSQALFSYRDKKDQVHQQLMNSDSHSPYPTQKRNSNLQHYSYNQSSHNQNQNQGFDQGPHVQSGTRNHERSHERKIHSSHHSPHHHHHHHHHQGRQHHSSHHQQPHPEQHSNHRQQSSQQQQNLQYPPTQSSQISPNRSHSIKPRKSPSRSNSTSQTQLKTQQLSPSRSPIRSNSVNSHPQSQGDVYNQIQTEPSQYRQNNQYARNNDSRPRQEAYSSGNSHNNTRDLNDGLDLLRNDLTDFKNVSGNGNGSQIGTRQTESNKNEFNFDKSGAKYYSSGDQVVIDEQDIIDTIPIELEGNILGSSNYDSRNDTSRSDKKSPAKIKMSPTKSIVQSSSSRSAPLKSNSNIEDDKQSEQQINPTPSSKLSFELNSGNNDLMRESYEDDRSPTASQFSDSLKTMKKKKSLGNMLSSSGNNAIEKKKPKKKKSWHWLNNKNSSGDESNINDKAELRESIDESAEDIEDEDSKKPSHSRNRNLAMSDSEVTSISSNLLPVKEVSRSSMESTESEKDKEKDKENMISKLFSKKHKKTSSHPVSGSGSVTTGSQSPPKTSMSSSLSQEQIYIDDEAESEENKKSKMGILKKKKMKKSSSEGSISDSKSKNKSRKSNETEDEEKEARKSTEEKLDNDEESDQTKLSTTAAVQEKLKNSIKRYSRPNQPIEFTDSAFGFPLPPPSHSTLVMLDYRFPVHVERAIYRLSHLKLANPKRSLREQVLLSNFMYAYLNLVNHTLYLQQMNESSEDAEKLDLAEDQDQIEVNDEEMITIDLDEVDIK